MPTLLLWLEGPMQSWGTTSRFDERDTQLEPSKSGVLGLLCAALGRDRAEPLEDLAALRMGVRVDREGAVMRDYQTATGVVVAGTGKPAMDRTVVSPRFFLADAAFFVGLEGANRAQLETLQSALRDPVWPLALGRKSFVPCVPVWLPDGVQSDSLEASLRTYPSRIAIRRGHRPSASVRLLLEHGTEGAVRLDQPVAPFAERRFRPRFVTTEMIDVPHEAHA